MLDLPRKTHRYFIEALSKTNHIIKSIKARFLSFIEGIRRSKKEVLRCVLHKIEHDCRSNTGRNLRQLSIQTSNADQDITDMPYRKLQIEDKWKINFEKELIDIKSDDDPILRRTEDDRRICMLHLI